MKKQMTILMNMSMCRQAARGSRCLGALDSTPAGGRTGAQPLEAEMSAQPPSGMNCRDYWVAVKELNLNRKP